MVCIIKRLLIYNIRLDWHFPKAFSGETNLFSLLCDFILLEIFIIVYGLIREMVCCHVLSAQLSVTDV